MLQVNAARGFPGMIDSIDCMKRSWKNCPSVWRGVFQDASKDATVVLETIASEDLRIWHAFVGMPGSNND
ncbi:hypothetical protein PHMEG_00032744 [Phytophthora megakarya]|nr:hypothetical protein PHMEG_00032744 [Phytophthora megakarya]